MNPVDQFVNIGLICFAQCHEDFHVAVSNIIFFSHFPEIASTAPVASMFLGFTFGAFLRETFRAELVLVSGKVRYCVFCFFESQGIHSAQTLSRVERPCHLSLSRLCKVSIMMALLEATSSLCLGRRDILFFNC